jgi:hypothetical protein
MVSSEQQLGWRGQPGGSDFRKRSMTGIHTKMIKTLRGRWQCTENWDSCAGVRQPLGGCARAQLRGNIGTSLPQNSTAPKPRQPQYELWLLFVIVEQFPLTLHQRSRIVHKSVQSKLHTRILTYVEFIGLTDLFLYTRSICDLAPHCSDTKRQILKCVRAIDLQEIKIFDRTVVIFGPKDVMIVRNRYTYLSILWLYLGEGVNWGNFDDNFHRPILETMCETSSKC